jgi:hypothetical protein
VGRERAFGGVQSGRGEVQFGVGRERGGGVWWRGMRWKVCVEGGGFGSGVGVKGESVERRVGERGLVPCVGRRERGVARGGDASEVGMTRS